jgi:beta-lactamase class A
MKRLAILLAALVFAGALPVQGDEAEPEQSLELPRMPSLDPGLDRRWTPLWELSDVALQIQLEAALGRLEFRRKAETGSLAVVLVDITKLEEPRVASVNGDRMMYAASLPKIAVLLAAMAQVAEGKLELDAELQTLLEQMIRRSSNPATTEVMHRVGKENIARVLKDPRYALYDERHNGGLWVGKDYAPKGLWKRDPIHNLSHGATPMQVARFYYLLETERLVSPEHSRLMKEIMGSGHLNHKFVAMLRKIDPQAEILRKSGTWRTYHADSVLVRRKGRSYIAVALVDDADGRTMLQQLIRELDTIIMNAKR